MSPFWSLGDTLAPSPAGMRRPYNDGVTARGTVSKKHQTAIRAAMAAQERADEKLHAAIRAAATDPVERASIRELATFTHLAPGTIQRIVNG